MSKDYIVSSFRVGLTATPDNQTFGYFNKNLVSDYGYEKAVIDGVLVPYNIFTIETKIITFNTNSYPFSHQSKKLWQPSKT